MSKPTYTIGIPVYKRVFGFHEALQSALNVDGCTEVVVCDDMSDHNEFEQICNSFNDERLKYHRNKTNIGLFGNWNNCIQHATGDFVSILCSDDYITPNAYTEFYKAYTQHPDIDVFFGPFCTFTDNVETVSTIRSYPPGVMNSEHFIEDAVQNSLGFPVLTITRKSILLKFPFVEKPHSGNDWLWIYSNASSFKLYANAAPINYWRLHANQDAVNSRSITVDCWPMIFASMQEQLLKLGNPLAAQSGKRAKGVVLSWLLNDYGSKTCRWRDRLTGAEAKENVFINKASEIANSDWLLKSLMNNPKSALYANIGRVARKMKYYPAP